MLTGKPVSKAAGCAPFAIAAPRDRWSEGMGANIPTRDGSIPEAATSAIRAEPTGVIRRQPFGCQRVRWFQRGTLGAGGWPVDAGARRSAAAH